MTLRFAVVHESEADFITATELADRELKDALKTWLDEDLLPYHREWVAYAKNGQRLTWKSIKSLALEAGVRVHQGHFDGESGKADSFAARRAIRFLIDSFSDLDAVVLMRDQDKEPERRGGLEQARNENHITIPIVIGFAIVEREAWVICGFDPESQEETERLEKEKTKLGSDPRLRSHELTACKDDSAKRSPKRVLRELSQNNRDRERQCWQKTGLNDLRERGAENGLAEYLDEVKKRLAVLIGHVSNT